MEVERAVALPTASNELSAVAGQVGYEFSHPNMDGRDVASIYANCVENREEVPDRVFEYNRDDVLAVKEIVEWVEQESPDRERAWKQKEKGGDYDAESSGSRNAREDSDYEPIARKFEELGKGEVLVVSDVTEQEIKEMTRYLSWAFGSESVHMQLLREEGRIKATFSK
jgi:hypothetical protein